MWLVLLFSLVWITQILCILAYVIGKFGQTTTNIKHTRAPIYAIKKETTCHYSQAASLASDSPTRRLHGISADVYLAVR